MQLTTKNFLAEVKIPGDSDSIKEALMALACNDYKLEDDLEYYRENPQDIDELDDYQKSAFTKGFNSAADYLVDTLLHKAKSRTSPSWESKIFANLAKCIMDMYPTKYFDYDINFVFDTNRNVKIVSIVYLMKG